MWDRKYEQGRWNGLTLNILNTTLDGGKRVQVSEIPFADLPHIIVMGSKTNGIGLEVVFVGVDSLVDANALLDDLNTTPRGSLEHPWLGELHLVFESASQKVSTLLGKVTLSLKFIRDKAQPRVINKATITSVQQQQASLVEAVSTDGFIKDVDAMSVFDLNRLQSDFTSLVTELVSISNMLNIPSQMLSALNQEINQALVAISSIANAPAQFAEQLSKTIDSVASAIRYEETPSNEAIDPSHTAQHAMLDLIDLDSPSDHYNIQLVVATVKMSNDIAQLEQATDFDIVTSSVPPSTIINGLDSITEAISLQINVVTDVSTLESLEIFDALVDLQEGVNIQASKVQKGSAFERTVECPRFMPALVIAHEGDCSAELVLALNTTQHPLFLRGTIALRVPE